MRVSAPGTGFERAPGGIMRMSFTPPPQEPPSPATPPGATGLWLLASVAMIGLVIGAGGVALVTSPAQPATGATRGLDGESTAATAASHGGVSEYTGPPKWEGVRPAGRGRQAAITYELSAEHDIWIFGKRVTPVLTVRCEAGVTDVFVLTESAAKIEESQDHRTVHVGFDGAPQRTERWVESADYDALFAPDGPAMAREIAASRTLRFGFTPYNAPPAVADFDVRGFDQLIASVAKSCRWK
jgi:hypothetical protein